MNAEDSKASDGTKRRVMIATPTGDGTLGVDFVHSLVETLKLASSRNTDIFPVFVPHDSLLVRARNRLLQIAVAVGNVDDLVFIDADMGWNPEHFFRILSHQVDFVGGTARQKTLDIERYCFKPDPAALVRSDGLIEVRGIGTGFLRLSARCFNELYRAATPYRDGAAEARAVFEVGVVDGELTSEDILLCFKWQARGGKTFLDTEITCRHTGSVTFDGDVRNFFKK